MNVKIKILLDKATEAIKSQNGKRLDILDLTKPYSRDYANKAAKIISKLSPLLGNMIEFTTVDVLNEKCSSSEGKWIRQDPGFPDALFKSDTVLPNPGVEIKAWFPFSTEITARFKDSETHFLDDQVNVALIAWIPEFIIWGTPVIIDSLVVSAKSVAHARDLHYHRPPNYIIFEPEDTSDRTSNLQQTNTNGYVIQPMPLRPTDNAEEYMKSIGLEKTYSCSPEYQKKLKKLMNRFKYRLDTNYAKIDRIEHKEIEAFKEKVLSTTYKGRTIKEWGNIISMDHIPDEIVDEIIGLINN